MKINFLYRKPYDSYYSIEWIFQGISKVLGIEFVVDHKTSPYSASGVLNRIKAILWATTQKNKTDLYHVTGDVHFLVFGLPRKRTILTIHDLGFLKRGTYLNRAILWLFWVYLPVRCVRYVTCVSEETKKEILKYAFCKSEKIKVIYNYVREDFKNEPKLFNKNCPVLLHIGTYYNKNIEKLIYAVKGMTCHLRIVGRISAEVKKILLENGINYTNTFDLTDYQLFEEYIKSDVLTFCSTIEGFGLPIIEANVVGRVVVTSNVSSMPEIAGNAACLVDPFNIESIRSGIKRVIEDDEYRQLLISNGIENVKRFEIKHVAASYSALYKNILKGIG